MTVMVELRRPSPVIAIFCFLCFCSFSQKSNGQKATPTTDPAEVRALNSLFQKWDTQAVGLWNISGELCTGSAVNDTGLEDENNNPAIKCDCIYENGTTCHITKLRVYALNKRGEIPEEITALTKLTFLKIDKNYFTGSLPSFIGNLSALTILSIARNAFSGPIPKELGNLKELTILSFGSNNFSGTLPPELGNLVKLEQLYINSCGLDGEIPSQFANLRSMRIMWASDNPFTGNIPDFIGNWNNLTYLGFQGNSLEGPIPSSFSNLTSLTILRISDLSNVSSSLDFTKDMKSLIDLVLRNALISGNISSDIGGHQSLQNLDLSFNNLTGEIPSALFNLDSLTSLFLGNNSLSGTLPAEKREQLATIDLSYNELSGTFPSWVVTSSLNLNLIANNFTFDASNTSVFPGLNCLQRNFPCHRDTPLYSNFSLHCGGSKMTSYEGITYEAENSPLSDASYYIASTDKWAVSQVGLLSIPTYEGNTFQNTFPPEFFQTPRISLGSLRYYGLGLENGPYTLRLSFVETAFEDPRLNQTWQNLGRREFDIYIQGELKLKDFDISKEAGEVGRAIVKKFNYNVSENYLEIHLFWAGKGTCCIPIQGTYGPTISTLSVISDFTPTVSGYPPTTPKDKNRTGLIVGYPPTTRDGGSSSTPNITRSSSGLNIWLKFAIGISTAVAGSIIVIFALCFLRREGILYKPTIFWRKKTKNDLDVDAFIKDNGFVLALKRYRYSNVKKITKSFTDKLGQGGYGCVYKGKLSDGCLVAVKVLNESKGNGEEFLNEVASISRTSHVNVVTLLGFCYERTKRALIYEFMPNGSLDQFIYIENSSNTHSQLEWKTLYQIAVGIARGLEYLHIGCNMRILHFDIKPHNILLDEEFCPKISDFGLAKLCQRKESIISMQGARGTAGYIAPEIFNRHFGGVSYKSDVYSYGMLVLEIVGGRRNIEVGVSHISEIYFPHWIFKYLEPASTELRLNRVIIEEEEEELARKMILVGLWCIQTKPSDRPSMTKVVEMLEGSLQSIQIPPKPFLSSPPRSLPQHSSSVSVPEPS